MKTKGLVGIITLALIVAGSMYFLQFKSSPSFAEGELSREKEFVTWTPQLPEQNIVDGGEQPGWTKSKDICNRTILTKEDARSCLENYHRQIDTEEIKKDFIVVKHEKQDNTSEPILSFEPTIEPYKIEVFRQYFSIAVDWEGNIYYYQTWA